jgi:hypothetical protein
MFHIQIRASNTATGFISANEYIYIHNYICKYIQICYIPFLPSLLHSLSLTQPSTLSPSPSHPHLSLPV